MAIELCSRVRSISLLTAVLMSTTAFAQAPGPAPDRRILPPPDPAFTGRIGKTLSDSTPAWPERLKAPEGAPNVLLIMTDDIGFASASTFGGPVPTPNLDRLAKEGLRYNHFHTTGICSPSRAALLTGRNHHHVGMGMLADLPLGFPGYNGAIPHSAATIAKTLNLNGYSTAMFGKHHNIPPYEQSLAGPFDTWPTGLGFDYFFGFIGGDMHKWQPRLFRNVTPVDDPLPQGTLLDQALVDDAIKWMHNQKASAPDRPFFLYFADPSLHAPHQAPPEWIARFKGKFDQGWDELRKQSYQRQVKAGIIPKGTVMSPRPAEIPAWDSLPPEDKAYQSRLMEVAAAELAWEDDQVGRLLDELDRMGLSDNTLVIFIEGDNGASGEGGPTGFTNEVGSITLSSPATAESMRRAMPDFGGPKTFENYSVGWAWSLDTPFPWMKQVASHLGGTTNGLVMAWPKHIPAGGAVRTQFSHVIDIAPTILDAAHIPQPESVNGVKQMPYDGVSLVPTWTSTKDRPRTQYFEILGNMAIYQNGWLANTTPRRMPWSQTPTSTAPARQWELYDLTHDFAQAHDLAAKMPDKLKALQRVFDTEAKRNNVYPINELFASDEVRKAGHPRANRKTYDYWGSGVTVLNGVAPDFAGRSFAVSADITVKDHASGVILATGSRFAGWSFFLDHGTPVAVEAQSEKPGEEFRVVGDKELAPGTHHVRFAFESKGGLMAGGVMRVEADGVQVGEGPIPRTIVIPANNETLDTGKDVGVPVTDYVSSQGKFEGTISHVQVTFDAPKTQAGAPKTK
jgi:arylsulfatase